MKKPQRGGAEPQEGARSHRRGAEPQEGARSPRRARSHREREWCAVRVMLHKKSYQYLVA